MRLSRRACRVLALVVAGCLPVAACGGEPAPDTPPVVLAEGHAGSQAWRLEGRRQDGEPCTSLVLVGVDRPPVGRCGFRRTPLRHLDPVAVTVGDRLLVTSPLPADARRVRLDTLDGAIRVEPARQAAGFPARFLLVELDPRNVPVTVRVFADGGRALVD